MTRQLLWPELDPESIDEGWLAVPKDSAQLTSSQVLDAVAGRHPMDGWNERPGRWVFVREVCAQTGLWGEQQRFDALAIGLVPSVKYARVVYEVKVSRGDWLRELKPIHELGTTYGYRRRISADTAAALEAEPLPGDRIVVKRKWDAALAVSTEYWVAAPPFVVQESELPPEAGLVEVRPWGAKGALRARVVRKAPVRETPDPGPAFWASVLREAVGAERRRKENPR